MSLIVTPRVWAFSRSMSRKTCGLLVAQVEKTPCRRRVLIGGQRPARAWPPASSSGVRPCRSSSWYSKPLPVPSPMIGGRLKGMIMALGDGRWSGRASRSMTASTLRSGVVRSAKGLSRPMTKALLDCTTPSMMLKPGMVSTWATAGSAAMIPSTCLTTSRVRLSEAPWGSWISAMKAP